MARLALALISLLALASFPAPIASAAPFDVDLDVSVGVNWKGITFSPASQCIKYRFYANFTGNKEAWVVPIWFFQSTDSFAADILWAEPAEDRIKITTATTGTTFLQGSEPEWDLGGQIMYPPPGQPDLQVCGTSFFQKVAFAAPGATNARLRIDFSNPATTVSTTYSGSNAFLITAQDYAGGTVIEGEHFPLGFSHAQDREASITLPAGLLAAYVTTSFDAGYSVDGPGAFADQGWTCRGGSILLGLPCEPSNVNWAAIGRGKAATAPAGLYKFKISRADSPIEALHFAAVGAPINW